MEIKFLLQLVRPYRHIVILLTISSIFGSMFDSISIGMLVPLLNNLQGTPSNENIPLVFQWVVQLLGGYSINTQIFLTIGFVVIAFLIKNLFWGISIKMGYWLSTKLTYDLRIKAMTVLVHVGIDHHQISKAGHLIDKALHNTEGIEVLIGRAIIFFVHVATLALLFSLLLILSWPLTLISLILGILMSILVSRYTRNLPQLGDRLATQDREMYSTAHEILAGIYLIKAYSKENHQIALFSKMVEKVRRDLYRLNFRVYSVHLITDCAGIITLGIFFCIAMIFYNMNSTVLLSRILPFIYILTRIIPILKFMDTEKAEILKQWPMVRLVRDLLRTDNKPFISNGHLPFEKLECEMRFQSVTFSYLPDKKLALSNASFHIPAGKTTAIVGRSGSGKSTIVNLILRFYDPQQGQIMLDGTPLVEFDLESYHKNIGIVSQDTFLFHNTVAYNIAFAAHPQPSDMCIIEAAKKAGAHDFIMALPLGYDTIIGDRGVTLSGGQRQRLSIARAILNDPKILVLDEATSALDTQTEKLIYHSIAELSEGRTVIIIAHRLSTIRNADQIIVLRDGCVVEIGEMEQLLKNKAEYYHLANVQE